MAGCALGKCPEKGRQSVAVLTLVFCDVSGKVSSGILVECVVTNQDVDETFLGVGRC